MKLTAPIAEISYLKAKVILQVFEECGLIELSKADPATYYIRRLEADGKRNLSDAPLMKIITNK